MLQRVVVVDSALKQADQVRRKLIGLLAVKGEKSSDVINSQRDPTVLAVALVAVAPEKVRRLRRNSTVKNTGDPRR
ncbi:hypothetical protein ASD52_30170 [Ensifer sp. Root142]|nr:hypothetical protein ASD52_30170 [Ensifer sp. Root142]